MNDKTHNGYQNYATWRVNLEIFDGLDPREMGWSRLDQYDLAAALKDYTIEVVGMTADQGLALDYALAFLSDVDWHEIAFHMIQAYAEEVA
jgi:hypothetical protein